MTSKLVPLALRLLNRIYIAPIDPDEIYSDLKNFTNHLIKTLNGPAVEALKDVKVPKFCKRIYITLIKRNYGGLFHYDTFKIMFQIANENMILRESHQVITDMDLSLESGDYQDL